MEITFPTRLSADYSYIEGIRAGSRYVIDDIYKRYFPKIRNMVVRNSGSSEDAQDIFQEALLAIFHNASSADFELTCQFGTYLYSISRNLWLKHLRKRNVQFIDIEGVEDIIDSNDLDEVTLRLNRYHLYKKKFAEIGEQCQQLLLRFMQGADMKTIAEEFGFTSVAYAKKRKFKCKELLITKIEQDEDYKKMMTL